jgi:hypothetical protein
MSDQSAEKENGSDDVWAAIMSPVSDRKTRAVMFRAPRLHWALRAAADWLLEHYFDGEPQAITIEHPMAEQDEDGPQFSEWGGGWIVQVFCDV